MASWKDMNNCESQRILIDRWLDVLRHWRDDSSGEVHTAFSEVCDRVDVLLGKLAEAQRNEAPDPMWAEKEAEEESLYGPSPR